jgi:protein TonB
METRNVLFEKKYLNIIFDNRNKEYGAYQLRMEYEKNIAIALFSSLLLLAIIPLSIKAYAYFFPTEQLTLTKGIHDLWTGEIETTEIEIVKATPPKGNPPHSDALAPMVVTQNASEAQRDTTNNDELLALNTSGSNNGSIGIPTGELGGNGPIVDVVEPKPEVIAPPKIASWVEEMPEFPGGEEALLRYIRTHVDFPAREREEGISGTAIVSFVVDENGQVVSTEAVRSTTKGFKNASEAVVAQLPKFKPGKQSGKPVKVRLSVPIKFQAE